MKWFQYKYVHSVGQSAICAICPTWAGVSWRGCADTRGCRSIRDSRFKAWQKPLLHLSMWIMLISPWSHVGWSTFFQVFSKSKINQFQAAPQSGTSRRKHADRRWTVVLCHLWSWLPQNHGDHAGPNWDPTGTTGTQVPHWQRTNDEAQVEPWNILESAGFPIWFWTSRKIAVALARTAF